MNRIRQLSATVANQIAAGEVIERPASVVKELLENAWDAQASSIVIELGYGGLTLIRISDNGQGIYQEDLPLAIAAHATSKITQLEDLYTVNTCMGFRGEALASIASVSKLTLTSKPEKQAAGSQLSIDSGQVAICPHPRSTGTTVEVCDIFYNAPVRKAFLKSELIEYKAIEQVVKRFALSTPHIALTLIHNGKVVLQLPSAQEVLAVNQRIIKIAGKNFLENAIPIQAQAAGLVIQGWISNYNYQRNQNDKMWVYVNGRMVKDKLITHAIKLAYGDDIYPDRYPGYLLNLMLNPAEVDVNVHPAKIEVRFKDPLLIHDFIYSHLKKQLNQIKPAMLSEKKRDNPYEKTSNSWIPAEEMRASLGTWIVLNEDFAIGLVKGLYWLINVKVFHQEWLQDQLRTRQLPLASRPLLVPITMELPHHNAHFAKQHQLLANLGIEIAVQADKIVINTIPLEVQDIAIKAFLTAFFSKIEMTYAEALTLLTLHQTFNALHLTNYYYQAYCDYLTVHSSIHAQPLTAESCLRFFLGS